MSETPLKKNFFERNIKLLYYYLLRFIAPLFIIISPEILSWLTHFDTKQRRLPSLKDRIRKKNNPLDEFSNAVKMDIIAGDDCTNFLRGRMIRVMRRIIKGNTPLTPHAAMTLIEVTKKSRQFMNDDRYSNRPFATVRITNSPTNINIQTRWMTNSNSRWGPHISVSPKAALQPTILDRSRRSSSVLWMCVFLY